MIITQYPILTAGGHSVGDLYEMTGANLQFLPQDLVASISDYDIHTTTSLARFWPLDHVDPTGTRAYFRQQIDAAYYHDSIMKIFATPQTPPREEWTDFDIQ